MARYTGKQIDTKIRAIAVKGQAYLELVQDVGLACIEHAAEHGDTTKAERLAKAVIGKNYGAAIVLWFHTFSPIRFDGDGKTALAKPTSKLFVPFNVEGATAEPWYTMEKDPVKKPLDLEALMAVIKRMPKTVESAKERENGLATDAGILEAFVAHMEAARASFVPPTVVANTNVEPASEGSEAVGEAQAA